MVLITLPVFIFFFITNQIQLDVFILYSPLIIYSTMFFSFLEVIFGFALASVVIDKTNSMEAIKSAINIVKKYPCDYIILSILLFILSQICLFIPFVGILLFVFFVLPLFVFTFLRIYKP